MPQIRSFLLNVCASLGLSDRTAAQTSTNHHPPHSRCTQNLRNRVKEAFCLIPPNQTEDTERTLEIGTDIDSYGQYSNQDVQDPQMIIHLQRTILDQIYTVQNKKIKWMKNIIWFLLKDSSPKH